MMYQDRDRERACRFSLTTLILGVGLTLVNLGFIAAQTTTPIRRDLWEVDKKFQKFNQAYGKWAEDAHAKIRKHAEEGKSLYSPDLTGDVKHLWLKYEVSQKFRKLERELGF